MDLEGKLPITEIIKTNNQTNYGYLTKILCLLYQRKLICLRCGKFTYRYDKKNDIRLESDLRKHKALEKMMYWDHVKSRKERYTTCPKCNSI